MGHGKYIDPFKAGDSLGLRPRNDNVTPSEASVSHHRVKAGESLNLEYVVLPGESKDIDITIDLVGPGAEAHIKALYLCKADEKVNFHILMHHRAPGCKSTQRINGIAGGEAQVHFDGTIVVAPDAQQTEAYQENHNIVLTDTAKVDTRPQLEIYADDVKCSHGATVGQLNADELFYMRSRGVPEAEARTLQMLSFLSPVIPAGREGEIEQVLRSYAE
ncbi:MAG: SufD family Fe-S cluster assembly protein [Bacteroidales bacterium]|nr:SufD family Fe-S cluster assembly protein [Bacteroidales bacterium]